MNSVSPYASRLTIYGNILTLCPMRHALCAMRGSVHLAPYALRLAFHGRVFTLCSMLFALCGMLVSGSGTIER